ncbi:MAG: hypothetical protein Q9163_001880 [Psora crenata]
MPIVEVTARDSRQLRNIANAIASAKKVVVVTGAGISTSCGIPDFRTENGLYSLIQAQHKGAAPREEPMKQRKRLRLSENRITLPDLPHLSSIPTNVKGKDLFDAMIWKDPASTSTFYRFIASLRRSIRDDVRTTAATHRFIRKLRDGKRLVRCYTQNIDGLEAREGLSTDLARGKGSRSRFAKKVLEKCTAMARALTGGAMDGGCEVVQLHGNLESLRCTLCLKTCRWDEVLHSPRFFSGRAPMCQSCLATDQSRVDRGKRGTKVGTLRPNVVLYGEEHPSAETIGGISSYDLSMSPDLLLILGTSLHVHGLKFLVREFAKSVHARAGGKGKVVFVNLSKPAESVWKDIIDFWVSMDCDEWVIKMRDYRPDIWQVQGELGSNIKRNFGSGKVRGNALKGSLVKYVEADKENIILDSEDSPPLSWSMPKVIVSTPTKPKLPLFDRCWAKSISFNTLNKRTGYVIPDSDCQSSLLTPPSSNTPTPTSRSAKKRKSSPEAYNEECEMTPSKRRKSFSGVLTGR